MPKRSLRSSMLARRGSLLPADCVSMSQTIQQLLLALPEFLEAKVVALYSPVGNEVATGGAFAAALQGGKTVVFPRVIQQTLEFATVRRLEELRSAAFGIAEPTAGEVVPLGAIDLMVIPGVAFDRRGHRLGFGKGFYDRTLELSAQRPVLVGFCFGFQLVERLPAESHDVCMDLLITEEKIFRIFDQSPQCGLIPTRGGGPWL